jgi:peptide/nickel transport system ATP-binding protein
MKSKLISVNNLKVSSENKKLVKGISFDLNRNEILGIIGESGSGKSLTALSILSLIKFKGLYQSGEIFYADELIDKNNQDNIIRNEISIIFQDPMSYLNPSMKCGEQILEALKIKDKNQVLSLINKVKINEPELTYNKYPHQLSGGQQQRIMIAIAIAKEPNLIIADEATSSLDSLIKKDIINLLMELKNEYKLSLIIVSHNLNLVSKISNYVLVMNDGLIVEEGSTNKVFKNPKENYTKKLIDQNNKLKKSKRKKIVKANKILNIENLELSIKGKHILQNISFKIIEGETIGIIGQSGSGKTTISRCIIGFYKNYDGKIHYKGKEIKSISRYNLSKEIQLIFQDPYSALNPNIKIIVNKEEYVQKSLETLKLVNLEGYENRMPSELSGGERQRVVIARALCLKPKLIICDECVSALDKSIQFSILKLLDNLKKEMKLTYIFISHDLALVKIMSDRIIVLNDGQIVDENPTSNLFKNPKKYTKKLIDAII